MACASSRRQGQIPVVCQFYDCGNTIEWKCKDCKLLLCNTCKDGVHLNIFKKHTVIHIDDMYAIEKLKWSTCIKLLFPKCILVETPQRQVLNEEGYHKICRDKLVPKQNNNIRFEILKYYISDLTYIHFLEVCSDSSVWIGDTLKLELQQVKLMENRTERISSLSTKIYGMANTHSNNLLIATDETKLKLINTLTGQITNTMIDLKPLFPTSIYFTRDYRVIIGAKSPGQGFPVTGRRELVVMDQEGNKLKEYKHDNLGKQLFTYPEFITSTSNGNICVVDILDDEGRGRVVVLAQRGAILGIYTGHSDVNTEDEPFTPSEILTTPSDNLIVTDTNNNLLHMLTCQGQPITYYNISDMGILGPCTLALSLSGTIYIGCANERLSPLTKKAKIFELDFSGI